jgi:nucleoside-diphosphate-sugar epimerase
MASALNVKLRTIDLPGAMSTVAFGVDRSLAALGIYWQNMHLLGEGNWHVGISCEKAKQELGYRPTVGLEEGMQSAVAWCRAQGQL